MAETIEMHRASRQEHEKSFYVRPTGNPTEEEVDDFIASNVLFDTDLQEQLVDPGLLGFESRTVRVTETWMKQFRENVLDWAQNNSWLAADLPWVTEVASPSLIGTELWIPSGNPQPIWVSRSPTALLLAGELLRSGRMLDELPWRVFEEMLGQLLEADGWSVSVTPKSKDGGVDVIADKHDPVLGSIRSLWQAKRYSSKRHVLLSDVRELSGVLEHTRETKGVMVTTGRLTRGALNWVRQDSYRLDYRDGPKVEEWVRTILLG